MNDIFVFTIVELELFSMFFCTVVCTLLQGSVSYLRTESRGQVHVLPMESSSRCFGVAK